MQRARTPFEDWQFACPQCGLDLTVVDADAVRCHECVAEYRLTDGIWHFLPDDRERFYRDFTDRYTRIRHFEGRIDDRAEFYRALPDCPSDHPIAWQWNIRRKSFHALLRLLRSKLSAGTTILDVGAGNCWLSNRLAEHGYRLCSVDLSTDATDGLGASRYYAGDWPVVQAEFDRLPLPDNHANMLIFNASLHYSTAFPETLKEACRVLQPGGLIIILDSPIYSDPASGRQMLDEQREDFQQRFGDSSDALPHEGYLTWQLLDELGAMIGVEWAVVRPWYGVKWTMRPLLARIRGGREPATFAILCGETRQFGVGT